ncbi:hypothetical protein OOK31_04070 [Streptomyces sp. NBC_00249]|nr:hypothetical protein [Streptomyces sp. NBC_00249]MCX5193075.1 hypothetical protein [Streptomyces sp. NBC_00249]
MDPATPTRHTAERWMAELTAERLTPEEQRLPADSVPLPRRLSEG